MIIFNSSLDSVPKDNQALKQDSWGECHVDKNVMLNGKMELDSMHWKWQTAHFECILNVDLHCNDKWDYKCITLQVRLYKCTLHKSRHDVSCLYWFACLHRNNGASQGGIQKLWRTAEPTSEQVACYIRMFCFWWCCQKPQLCYLVENNKCICVFYSWFCFTSATLHLLCSHHFFLLTILVSSLSLSLSLSQFLSLSLTFSLSPSSFSFFHLFCVPCYCCSFWFGGFFTFAAFCCCEWLYVLCNTGFFLTQLFISISLSFVYE